jgi:diguanylate cyclase (GGDEF)-like protein/PAS domain S-box-containing protein
MADALQARAATSDCAATTYEALIEFLNLAPVGIVKFAPDGKISMANAVAAQLLMPLVAGADLLNVYRVFAAVLPELRARVDGFAAPAGQIFDQLQLAVPGRRTVLTLGVHKIDRETLMAVVQDISRALEQEMRIRDDQQRFRAIFENIRDYAIYTVDVGGRIDEWNRSLSRLGGWEAADVAGASISMFFPPGPDGQARAADLLERAGRNGTAEFEGWGVRKAGHMFWGNTVATALPDHEGYANGYVLVTRDLTERKQLEDRLVVLATIDPLTGADNRRAGETGLGEAFRRWQRLGLTFAVLMLDCDHFKSINDRWGHDVGDDVLVALVRICRESLREADLVVRWGGEEFVVLLPKTGQATALAIAERLRCAIETATVEHLGDPVVITVSIGVATACAADTCADDVVRRADSALYRAKRSGRNRIAAG